MKILFVLITFGFFLILPACGELPSSDDETTFDAVTGQFVDGKADNLSCPSQIIYGSASVKHDAHFCTNSSSYPCDNYTLVEPHFIGFDDDTLSVSFKVPTSVVGSGWVDPAVHFEEGGTLYTVMNKRSTQLGSTAYPDNYSHLAELYYTAGGYNHYRVRLDWATRQGNHKYGIRCLGANDEWRMNHLKWYMRLIVHPSQKCDNNVDQFDHACDGNDRKWQCVNPGGDPRPNVSDSQWAAAGSCLELSPRPTCDNNVNVGEFACDGAGGRWECVNPDGRSEPHLADSQWRSAGRCRP